MSVRRIFAAVSMLATLLVLAPNAAPAGAAPPQDPVIVVSGFSTGPLNASGYGTLVDRLRRDGYHVELFVYPDYGVGDIRNHASRLASMVADVKARTGAAKVDLVAHSMGATVSREYLKNQGGTAHVDSLIMLGAANYGTAIANAGAFLTFGTCLGITACPQMALGSSFLNALNDGDDTPGEVRYTSIATRAEWMVLPYHSAFLANDGNIANITIQDQCWFRWPDHLGIIHDSAVYDGVRDALRGEPVRLDCNAR
jgi:triacylglycerol esterase/lipase EstA (alpha/beta hydrolase family)